MPNIIDIVFRASGADQVNVAFQGLRGGAAGARETLGELQTVMSGVGVQTGALTRAITATASPLGAVVGGFTAVAGAAMAGVQALSSNAREVERLMAVSGLGAEAADNLADTFLLLGTDASVLTNALFKLGVEVDNGGKALIDLGVSVRDAGGNVRAEGEILLDVRDKISLMGSASERSAALMELFGRAGRELAPIFALSRAEFEKWFDKAGGISQWNEDLQRTTKEYQRAVAELGLQYDALAQTIGAVLVPQLTTELRLMSDIVTIARDPITFAINVVFGGKGPSSSGGSENATQWVADNILPWIPTAEAIRDVLETGLFKQLGATMGDLGSKAARDAAKQAAISWSTAWEHAFAESSQGMSEGQLANLGRASNALAAAMKTHAASIGDAWDKAGEALKGFQSKAISLAIPDTVAREMVALRMEAENLAAANPLLASSFRALAESMIDIIANAERAKREMKALEEVWEDLKETPDNVAEAMNRFDAALLRTSDHTLKLVAGLAGAVEEGDQFGYSLTGIGTAVMSFGEALPFVTTELGRFNTELSFLPRILDALDIAILNDNIFGLITVFSNVTPEIERMTKSAQDAALEVALLTDRMEPLLAVAADERWASIGKGIEGAFLSVTDTVTKMFDAMIADTLKAQDVWDAFKSFLLNFAQTVLHSVFDPILKAAGSFTTQLIQIVTSGSGSVGQAFANTIGAGLGLGGGGAGFDPNTPGSGASGMGPFNTGGSGVSGFNVPIPNLSLIQLGWDALKNGWTAFQLGLDTGGSFLSSIGAGFSEAASVFQQGQGVSSLANLTAVVGTIVSVISAITATNDIDKARASLHAALYAAGPFTFGITALAAGISDAISFVVEAFGGPTFGEFIQSLFPDWDQIHKLRSQQRTNTGMAALGQTTDRILGAASIDDLITSLQQSIAGTASTVGGVLLQMVTNYQGKTIFEDQKFEIPQEVADELITFLRGAGFTPEEFSSGRVNSVGELLASSGIPNWEALVTGLAAFVGILQTVEKSVQDLSGMSMDELRDNAVQFFETLKTADELGKLGFEDAERAIKGQLASIASTFEGGIEALKDAAVKAILADPIQFLPFLDMSALKRGTETLDEATVRVAASLMILGDLMKSLDLEVMALTNPLGAATEGFKQTIASIEGADWAGLAEDLRNADPTDWATAAVAAHDLLVARYEAELALIQAISEATTGLFSAGVALTNMTPLLYQAGINVGALGLSLIKFSGELPTVESQLIGLGAGVQMFANQAMLAVATLDPAQIDLAVQQFGALMSGFYTAAAGIAQIEDPQARLAAWQTLLGDVGATFDALRAAGQAFVDMIARMIDRINAIAASIASAGTAIAGQAGWLVKAGVDIGALSIDMARLIDLFPTMGAKLSSLSASIDLFLAGIDAGQITTANGASGLTAILEGIKNSFIAAMQLSDPGQRLEALTAIMDNIGKLLSGLPPGIADALISQFSPEIQLLIREMQKAAADAAAEAVLIANQLREIMKGSGALSPENFLLLTVKGIEDALGIIIEGAGPLFGLIVTGMEMAGRDIADAIEVAGNVLADALNGFATPADQLAAALTTLDTELAAALYAAIDAAVGKYLPALHEGTGPQGTMGGPKVLAPGEIVIDPSESASVRAGRGYYGASGYQEWDHQVSGGIAVTIAPVMHFGPGTSRADAEYIAETTVRTVKQAIETGSLRDTVQRASRGIV